MCTRQVIVPIVALVLVFALFLSGCSRFAGEDTPVPTLPVPPTNAPPTPTQAASPIEPPEPSAVPSVTTYKIVDTGQSFCYNDFVSIPLSPGRQHVLRAGCPVRRERPQLRRQRRRLDNRFEHGPDVG